MSMKIVVLIYRCMYSLDLFMPFYDKILFVLVKVKVKAFPYSIPSVAGTKYCLVTEAHRSEQLALGCYAALPRVGFEPATY